MLNVFLTNLVTFGLNSNIVVNSGVGVVLFGREKKYKLFRYINTLLLMLGIVLCAIATFFLNQYVYLKFDLGEIKVGVLVFLVCLYNLLISFLWKKMSLFGHYLYERSCSYVFDVVFTIFAVLSLDLNLAIVPFILSVAALVTVVFATMFIIGFYVDGINSSSLKIYFRNVSARLFLIAIFAVILFYANMLV